MANYNYTRVYDSTYGHYDTDTVCDGYNNLITIITETLTEYEFSLSANDTLLSIISEGTLTNDDENTLDGIVVAYKAAYETRLLDYFKHRKIAEIKLKNTEVLEVTGFEYPPTSGQYFDLQLYSKSAWVGMSVADFYEFLTYPQPVRTIDDVVYNIDSSTSLAYFYAYGLARQKYIFDSSATLITSVKACTTVAQVLAIVDDRT